VSAPIIFVDIESTGLDLDRHEVWDIALIEADGTEHEWHVKPRDLSEASPDALRITRYYERAATWYRGSAGGWEEEEIVASLVVLLTAGKHLVGAVPSFDAAFLTKFLRRRGYVPAWHYHLVDVEALVAGRLRLEPPWDTKELARLIGVDSGLPEYEKHTAIGDARWAKAMYEAVFSSYSAGDA